MSLAVVRSLDAPQRLATAQELEDYEQELVDQYLLAAVGAGMGDKAVGEDWAAIFEFIRFTGRPVWTARPADVAGSAAGVPRGAHPPVVRPAPDRHL